ncbi:MAG: UvrD-helicase domain-containing protein [Lachnospiraceae bacterium]|nr:UvrD-helicase domain-containing protein [Lachnospiraceae bacterium]
MQNIVTGDKITYTIEQQGCINYKGVKRKDLLIRAAAGGGKSLVLMARAKKYIEEAKKNGVKNAVIIFTYNNVLVQVIKEWLELTPDDEQYVTVSTLHKYVNKVYNSLPGFKLGNPAYDTVKGKLLGEVLQATANAVDTDKYQKWGTKFWAEEFMWMRSMNIYDNSDAESYFRLERTGRGHEHPMSGNDRIAAYKMFCAYQDALRKKKVFDDTPQGDERLLYLSHNKRQISDKFKFEHILIDEAQDQSMTQMMCLKALIKEDAAGNPIGDVTICMDANQRIYANRWKPRDVFNVTSKYLSVPFRCTSQIDDFAESLKKKNLSVVDEEDQEEHIIPTATGEKPKVIRCLKEDDERRYVITQIQKWMKDDPEHTIGVMCYTNAAVEKVGKWLSAEHIYFQVIKNEEECKYSIKQPGVKLCTMHTAKGLEFMRVILPQFYQGMVPQSWALNDEEKLVQQRNVAYVGMTRAMHQLLIVYNGRRSQFLDEIDKNLYEEISFEQAVVYELKKPTPQYIKREVPMEQRAKQNDTTPNNDESDDRPPKKKRGFTI